MQLRLHNILQDMNAIRLISAIFSVSLMSLILIGYPTNSVFIVSENTLNQISIESIKIFRVNNYRKYNTLTQQFNSY